MPRASRRADVRATAARLFREHGFRAATMDLIADAVGLNKGTLYHYYPSKSAVLYELMSDQLDVTLGLIERVDPDGSPRERLAELLRLEANQAANASDELVVFFQELPWIQQNLTAEQAEDILTRVGKYREITQGLLSDGIASGEFRQLDVTTAHYSIIGILAYVPNWFRPRPGRSRETLAGELSEFILSGLSAPAS
ncbi:TetR/AcrR family transcriptional regulator [Microbacterium sp.]|uniref:TetR/AcrR family transcriptional regulator n=1 Tax=Microbacterium sp. TaxID=51671 RepID=UPI0037C9D142